MLLSSSHPGITIRRSDIVLKPSNTRVLFRPFEPEDPARRLKIIARVMELSDEQVHALHKQVFAEFDGRHQRLAQFFLRRFEAVRKYLLTDRPLTLERMQLIGSYFTQEYALESAALFNPSMVWAPDQTGLPKGSKRFIVSLRATGEGHLSSLCFRTGVVSADGQLTVNRATGVVTSPEVLPDSLYDKPLFHRKLQELGLSNDLVDLVMGALDDKFTLRQLEDCVQFTLRQHRPRRQEWEPLAKSIVSLARANYEIQCDPNIDISACIIFPYSPSETNGIEDARFVEFTDDDGSRAYYATYTAYDGNVTLPQLVHTRDFRKFSVSTLNGPEVRNKGLALFPRKINGCYAMLSRQDGENLYLMYSDMLHFWYTKEILLKPTYPWEYVQIGNCGSPIETEAGWLVLSHGVGPMRKYSIGAFLLDRDDPSKVIGRLNHPLLTPNENEREGYVPNVVYSCGGLVAGDQLIIPYAMSDYASTFATAPLQEVLAAMQENV